MSASDGTELTGVHRTRRRLDPVTTAVLGVTMIVLVAVAGLAVAVLTLWGSTREDASVHPAWHLEQGDAVSATPATLVGVVDGDTADFRLADGTVQRVRMIGIDAPEEVGENESYVRGAHEHLAGLLGANPSVYLEWDKNPRDRFGQALAYVWLTRPTSTPSAQDVRVGMVNARMLLDGWAHTFPVQPGVVYKNVKYREPLAECAAEARAKRTGYWAVAAPIGVEPELDAGMTQAAERTDTP